MNRLSLIGGLASCVMATSAFAGLDDIFWTPAEIAPALWFDATDSNTLSTSGSYVTNWQSKGVGGYGLSQTDTGKAPATGGSINGLDAVLFNGAESMTCASSPFGATLGESIVIFVMQVNTVAGKRNTFVDLNTGSVVAERYQVAVNWSSDPYPLYYDVGGASSPNRLTAASGLTNGEIQVFAYYNSPSLSTQVVHYTGTEIVSDDSGHSVARTGGFNMGHTSTSSCHYDVGELVVLDDVVSIDTLQKLEGYLAWKWELEGKLPSDHPYKDEPPGAPPAGTILIVR